MVMTPQKFLKKMPTSQVNRLMKLTADLVLDKIKRENLKALYKAKHGTELTDEKLDRLLASAGLNLVQESMRRDDVVPAHAIEKDIGRDMDSD